VITTALPDSDSDPEFEGEPAPQPEMRTAIHKIMAVTGTTFEARIRGMNTATTTIGNEHMPAYPSYSL
jgi:hypothetical protein